MNQPKFAMIKEFFSVESKPVTMQELRELSAQDSAELVELIVLARESAEAGLRRAA